MSDNKSNNLTAIILGALAAVIIASLAIIGMRQNKSVAATYSEFDSTRVIEELSEVIDSGYYIDTAACYPIDTAAYYPEADPSPVVVEEYPVYDSVPYY